MDSQLIQQELGNGSWKVEICNMIDEELEFPTPNSDVRKLIIDLGHVTYMNSMGILKWIKWLDSIKKNPAPIEIEFNRISISLIRALETIEEVLPATASVNSFYFYFYCPKCNAEENVLIENSPSVTEPSCKCNECSEPMEAELPFSSYQRLIQQAPR